MPLASQMRRADVGIVPEMRHCRTSPSEVGSPAALIGLSGLIPVGKEVSPDTLASWRRRTAQAVGARCPNRPHVSFNASVLARALRQLGGRGDSGITSTYFGNSPTPGGHRKIQ